MSVNNSDLNKLRDNANNVMLNVGDMVIDHISDFRGFLTKRIRHIDMVEDDVFLWEVKLFKTNENTNNRNMAILEEEGLKMSIAIGTVELHSTQNKDLT
jgi:hypothetical protein